MRRAELAKVSRNTACRPICSRSNENIIPTDIERYSDRFKSQAGRGGAAGAKLVELHASRRLDRELFPTAIFDTIIEKKKRLKATTGELVRCVLDQRSERGWCRRGGQLLTSLDRSRFHL